MARKNSRFNLSWGLVSLSQEIQYSQRHSAINHCDRPDISVGLFNLFTYFDMPFVKEILKIYLIEQKIYPNHQDEW
jgi:hypothetical protein